MAEDINVKIVGTDTDITIADRLQFILPTPDADGCFNNPYMVTSVTIYYIERDFVHANQYAQFDQFAYDPKLQAELEEAKIAACADPSDENLVAIEVIEQKIESSKITSSFYYKQARPVAKFGFVDDSSDDWEPSNNPAWLDPDQVPVEEQENVEENNILYFATDEDGNDLDAKFILDWNPVGMREGDYFICWTWQPLIAGDRLTAHTIFKLGGATQITTSIPTHFTNPKKYEILLERYLPEMFRSFLCEPDLTPPVIQELQKAIGKGFTFVEDMANQVIDLLDANATHESILPLLGNTFDVRLKSNDPTLWRRQIKQAVPNYKAKGTYNGLSNSFLEAGMTLSKFTRLWQVVSDYTYQELFNVEDDTTTEFVLSNTAILPVDVDNFELYYRGANDSEWTQLDSPTDYVDLATEDSITTMTWVGDELSVSPIVLEEGDSIRVVYEIVDVPDPSAQILEDYIRALPLADLRDERDQECPLKNWNTRVIEEDDPLFEVIVPIRHPFYDPLCFGKVRTEFPYSENVYNMEEYNGSKRNSKDPCDIDCDFLDPCEQCQSSLYNVDVEIEELSNDRLVEAQKVLEEGVPFHAVLHTINFSGSVNEFVQSPLEEITALVQYQLEEVVLSGEGQHIFNRAMSQPVALANAKRNMLADMTLAYSSAAPALAKNAAIVLYSAGKSEASEIRDPNLDGPFIKLDSISINMLETSNVDPKDNSNYLEVLSPSANAGTYSVKNVSGYYADVVMGDTISEPLNGAQFAFRLSNKILEETPSDITQDDYYTFTDDAVNFADLGTKGQFDVDNNPDYAGGVWQLQITNSGYTTYNILDVLPDGSLVLEDDGTLPTSNQTSLDWVLLDDSAVTIETGSTGELTVARRGRVDLAPGSTSSTIDDIRNLMNIGDYAFYEGGSETQYRVSGFVTGDTHQFYIEDYAEGDMAGVTIFVLRRLADNAVGFFGYRGVILDTSSPLVNLETLLPVQNGVNEVATMTEDNQFKENYLILLNPSSPDLDDPDLTYYTMSEIDGSTVTLGGGPVQDFTLAGTSVNYDVYQFSKQPVYIPARIQPDIPGHDFDYQGDPPMGLGGHLDRSGSEVITLDIETATPMAFYATVLNAANQGKNEVVDTVQQQESISFSIEYADGSTNEGEI